MSHVHQLNSRHVHSSIIRQPRQVPASPSTIWSYFPPNHLWGIIVSAHPYNSFLALVALLEALLEAELADLEATLDAEVADAEAVPEAAEAVP